MKTYHSHEYLMSVAQKEKPLLAFDENADFGEWHARAKSKLEELLGLPLQKCDDAFTVTNTVCTDEYKRIDFEYQSEEGYFVQAHLLVPLGLTEPVPGVICLQGHSSGKHLSIGEAIFPGDERAASGNDAFAVRAVREGFCGIAVDQRYMGVAGQNEKGTADCLTSNLVLTSMLLGRTPMGERVWDVQRLIDVIEAHLTEYIRADRIICMGTSGGGATTLYSGCMDERIYLTAPTCVLSTFDESIMAMHHCSCNFVPGVRKYFNMGDLACMIAPRRLAVVNGNADTIFPLHGAQVSFEVVRKAYKKLGIESLCQMGLGEGGHGSYPDVMWPIIHNLLSQN